MLVARVKLAWIVLIACRNSDLIIFVRKGLDI